MEKRIGFLLFDNYHQRKDTAGSRIRGKWLIKYWEEAEEFVQGKDYDVVIYQKAYWKEHARSFKGKKILDICDADWLDGIPVVEFMQLMDAITVPTESMKKAIEQFTDTPVFVVKDRIDLETLPERKVDNGKEAKKVVWFGYAHNAYVLDPALPLLGNLGLSLKVISNGSYSSSECNTESVTWDKDTVNEEIKSADFVILPKTENGRHLFKSDNKEMLARALGMAVAKTAEDVKKFIHPEERLKDLEGWEDKVKSEYDVRQSVKEMQEVVNVINSLISKNH